MGICSKTSADPLMQLLHKKYQINLLSLPVGQCDVGELVILKGDRTLRCDFNAVFSAPKGPDFAGTKNEVVAPIDETFSDEVDASTGLGVLDRLASAIGGARGKLKGKYSSASTLRLRLKNATRDTAELAALDRAVRDARIDKSQSLYRDGDRLFIINTVYRALGLEVKAKAQDGNSFEVQAVAGVVGEADVNFSGKRTGSGMVSWKQKTPLAFGVALLEMVRDSDGWRLEIPEEFVQVRGTQFDIPVEYLRSVGDTDGDAFVDIEKA